jgi:hypothetical protein
MIAGGYERKPAPWGLDGVPQDWNFKLLEPDWERFTPLMENAIKRVPSLETSEIVQLLNGPEGFTPDSEYLLGPNSGARLLGCLRVLRAWHRGRGRHWQRQWLSGSLMVTPNGTCSNSMCGASAINMEASLYTLARTIRNV